jgi:hypothetical protein
MSQFYGNQDKLKPKENVDLNLKSGGFNMEILPRWLVKCGKLLGVGGG